MIPSTRTLSIIGAWAVLGVVPGAFPEWIGPWWMLGGALFSVGAFDALLAWRAAPPRAERTAPRAVSMRAPVRVGLHLANPGRRPLAIVVFDHVPASLRSDAFPRRLVLPPRQGADIAYEAWPLVRGTARYGPVELRVRSPLGGFERCHRLPVETSVRIYPDFDAVRRYELMATEHRTSQLGVRRRPRRGAGREFHQLREYRPGDPLRQVDWKATSRFQRAISREYQDERDQQVILVLDCGRRMRAQDGGLSHLDAALDAALLVANVALRQGDAVGFATLGGVDRWLAPRKGRGQLAALLDGLFDLQAQPRASDHEEAATTLVARLPKRSLVVWVSNLRDEDGRELENAMQLLAKRHLVLLASLREAALDAGLEAPVGDAASAVRVAAIHHHLAERRRAQREWAAGGALFLDCVPAQLPVALVNGYLEVKAAGML